ncbi:Asp23/Gls24 family envelope stress response protein [Jiangella ureilytica]|uniref:Asp23/Gls24 family envelope stress response protein n=1 Tax=Jiangella ureilytica TaxID=2530374 RepID=A0A4R4RJ98_9ACTN|nr:Asp23/Gls24 family envelope stress response protein [Jiangella ureilytica]TDC49414.1 Asp23/Gls24 family envelope stress response protein [Jiangella ureilytica]
MERPGWSPDPSPPPAPTPEPDLAELVAAAVRAVPGVAGLYGGLFGEVATHLPGRRVLGVRIDDGGNAEVHVVLHWGHPVPATAYAVRRAVARLVHGGVHVVVDDIAAPPTGPAAPPAPQGGAT